MAIGERGKDNPESGRRRMENHAGLEARMQSLPLHDNRSADGALWQRGGTCRSHGWRRCGPWSARRSDAVTRRFRPASTRAIDASKPSTENGFSIKSAAPSLVAATAF